MKKILLLLLLILALGLFAAESSVLNEVGNIDSSAYSEDRKTRYTLKDETVTIWNVNPFKKIDSFETTINHLRNYVSEDINTSYLDKFSDEDNPLVTITKVPNRIRVESKYITEDWDIDGKYLAYGGLRTVGIVNKNIVSTSVNEIHVRFFHKIKFSNRLKYVCNIKIIINDKAYYQVHLNPLIKNKLNINEISFKFLNNEPGIKKNMKYVFTYSDGTEEIHQEVLSGTLRFPRVTMYGDPIAIL